MTIDESGFFGGDRVEWDDIEDYCTVDNMRRMFPGDCGSLTQDECDECAAEAQRVIEDRNAEEAEKARARARARARAGARARGGKTK